MPGEELKVYKQKKSTENDVINKRRYKRMYEKIKDLRQGYSKAVIAGTRSGNGQLVCNNYKILKLICGGLGNIQRLDFEVFINAIRNFHSSGIPEQSKDIIICQLKLYTNSLPQGAHLVHTVVFYLQLPFCKILHGRFYTLNIKTLNAKHCHVNIKNFLFRVGKISHDKGMSRPQEVHPGQTGHSSKRDATTCVNSF